MRRIRTVVVLPSLWGYEYTYLRSFARSVLGFLDFIFWGTAVAQMFGGVSVILMFKNYRCLFQESYLSLPGWLALATALTLLPTGVLAVSISVKCSRYQQGTFTYLLLLLLCLEMSSAAPARSYCVRTASQLESAISYLVHQHNWTCSQDPGNSAVEVIQRKLQCCGVHNYTDRLKASSLYHPACVPESCCKQKHSHCRGDLGHVEQLSEEGCLKKLEDQLYFSMLYVFWCCTVLSILDLLAAVSNGILMRCQPFHELHILDSYIFSQDYRY
ncbi:LOW QUALITY PROTEIN: tetraspanin-3-like [Haemorhous mexicanus]|uniref:LOW QUALITY PROTEIN: tetraspanin-3-like n=1 Tax=Haemorhous mexicanus TaxID=30427 RepID=UPI0028BE3485|nr:LOW QUALITY PROTEIN: tetraspanin-3-like [Haemorhous mexicanus]